MRSLIAVLALLLLPLAAQADKRLGLVIGNDRYDEVPALEKAGADARAVAAALEAQGYEIHRVIDANRREMNRRIADFTSQLEPGDTAFVFFAGHGVEIDGENYLLPTDIVAPESGERDFIKSESIALSALLDRVRATGARTTVAVIDACRNNPFANTNGRSIGATRGLGRITAPQGTFVIFSAGAGQLALDKLDEGDTGANSVFTRLLLPRLSQQGLELRPLMAGLRNDVRALAKTVNHDQFPAYYDELSGQFYFAASPKPAIEPAIEPAIDETAEAAAPARPANDRIREDFDLARDIGTPAALDAFLDRYGHRGDEFTVKMARELRASLKTPDPEPAQRVIAPVVPAPAPTARTARDIIRDTQSALNEAGCSAGRADGVAGRRTQSAFQRLMQAANTDMGNARIGTEAALASVRSAVARGVSCPVVAVRAPPAPQPAPAPGGAAAAQPAPAPVNLSMEGTWSLTAKCALLLKVTSTLRCRSVGGTHYSCPFTNSLGQSGNSDVYLNGREYSATDYLPGAIFKSWGKMAADGSSVTGGSTSTCTWYMRRG